MYYVVCVMMLRFECASNCGDDDRDSHCHERICSAFYAAYDSAIGAPRIVSCVLEECTKESKYAYENICVCVRMCTFMDVRVCVCGVTHAIR